MWFANWNQFAADGNPYLVQVGPSIDTRSQRERLLSVPILNAETTCQPCVILLFVLDDIQQIRERFVRPIYLKLHPTQLTASHTAGMWAAAAAFDEQTAELLLTEREWRGRQATGVLVGMRQWGRYTSRLSDLLLASETVYSGAGYCVGLTLLGGREAADGVARYLNRWLPETECRYDQHWAMGALVALDPTRAADFMRPRGPWATWIEAGHDQSQKPMPVGESAKLIRDAEPPMTL